MDYLEQQKLIVNDLLADYERALAEFVAWMEGYRERQKNGAEQ